MESIFASKYFLSKNTYHICNGIFIDTKFVIFFYFEARKDPIDRLLKINIYLEICPDPTCTNRLTCLRSTNNKLMLLALQTIMK